MAMPVGNQQRFPRPDFHRSVDAGAQVEAGRAGGGIVRRLVAQARVEQP
jgi:hypothetical protein